jgi:SAM-dependent methyltransferase
MSRLSGITIASQSDGALAKITLRHITWWTAEMNLRLVCPRCQALLTRHANELSCSPCQEVWPIVNGIPHFVTDFPYWGEMPQDRMQKVNELAKKGNWKAVLLDSTDPLIRKASEMILNLDRANWHWLANLPPDSRVLDLGAGTGTTSHALGQHYREVVAVEPVRERVDFMQQRFEQEGLSTVTVIRSSLWELPFERKSFDLVVMNGVLEWVAEGMEGDPQQLQEAALRNAFDLLKPGGKLYLGIENRICLGYFVGYPDPHSGVPFVTILPRPLAHWYARRKGCKGGYRNYLYSSRGYRTLLTKIGYSDSDIYVALPSYNDPRFLIPLDGNGFSYYAHNFTLGRPGKIVNALRVLLVKLDILKYFEYSFVIFAHKRT